MKNATMILIENFSNLVGTSFVGVNSYLAKTSGELANHVILANFDYSKAVKKDIAKLENATALKLQAISEKIGVDIATVNEAHKELLSAFVKNQSNDTKSAQSKAQSDLYVNICPAVRLNTETMKLHVYGLAISKQVIEKGTYKSVNSRPKTIAKNAIKKALNFSTSKFRNFIVDKDQLKAIASRGEIISI